VLIATLLIGSVGPVFADDAFIPSIMTIGGANTVSLPVVSHFVAVGSHAADQVVDGQWCVFLGANAGAHVQHCEFSIIVGDDPQVASVDHVLDFEGLLLPITEDDVRLMVYEAEDIAWNMQWSVPQ
jgi:hypothetical protein